MGCLLLFVLGECISRLEQVRSGFISYTDNTIFFFIKVLLFKLFVLVE